ncbi:MAG: methyltransferase type 11 [uncultured bacterium]|nr:MAG: methyltransferase type 11 [uncultured bacterium]
MFTQSLGDDLILTRLSQTCQPGDQFLDLCCGSGRVLTFPLDHGVKAVGVDKDAEMLAEARHFLPARFDGRYQLLQRDALDLDFEGQFRVVTCVSHCMSFFRGAETIQRLLERVYRSMVAGGLFFIESYVPGKPENGYYRKLTFHVDGGDLTCTLQVSEESDPSDGSVVKVFTYDLEKDDRLEKEVYRVGEVFLTPIIEMAKQIGFQVEGVYGDSNATVPFDGTSETQSLLLKKM